MVEPLDLTALFRAGMALMAALNLVLALVMFSRHWGMPACTWTLAVLQLQKHLC